MEMVFDECRCALKSSASCGSCSLIPVMLQEPRHKNNGHEDGCYSKLFELPLHYTLLQSQPQALQLPLNGQHVQLTGIQHGVQHLSISFKQT